MTIEKLENCPQCDKNLAQVEYDCQFCRSCGWCWNQTTPDPRLAELIAAAERAYAFVAGDCEGKYHTACPICALGAALAAFRGGQRG